jgi:hypothetical protein
MKKNMGVFMRKPLKRGFFNDCSTYEILRGVLSG